MSNNFSYDLFNRNMPRWSNIVISSKYFFELETSSLNYLIYIPTERKSSHKKSNTRRIRQFAIRQLQTAKAGIQTAKVSPSVGSRQTVTANPKSAKSTLPLASHQADGNVFAVSQSSSLSSAHKPTNGEESGKLLKNETRQCCSQAMQSTHASALPYLSSSIFEQGKGPAVPSTNYI